MTLSEDCGPRSSRARSVSAIVPRLVPMLMPLWPASARPAANARSPSSTSSSSSSGPRIPCHPWLAPIPSLNDGKHVPAEKQRNWVSVAETNGVILDASERSSGSQTKGNHRKPDGVEHPDKALYLTVSAESDTMLDIIRLGRQHARHQHARDACRPDRPSGHQAVRPSGRSTTFGYSSSVRGHALEHPLTGYKRLAWGWSTATSWPCDRCTQRSRIDPPQRRRLDPPRPSASTLTADPS